MESSKREPQCSDKPKVLLEEEMDKLRTAHLRAIVSRAPLVMVTVIFGLIALRYLTDPIEAASKAGITFTSPGGVTVARVGFAAFPLAFSVIVFSCLLSRRHLLAGLYMVLILSGIVMAVRILGMVLQHSSETAVLLVPEMVLMTLSIIGLRLELARARSLDGD